MSFLDHAINQSVKIVPMFFGYMMLYYFDVLWHPGGTLNWGNYCLVVVLSMLFAILVSAAIFYSDEKYDWLPKKKTIHELY